MSGAADTGVTAAPLSRGQDRFLRAWALNMALAYRMGQGSYPGFTYTDDEKARLLALGDTPSRGAVFTFLGAVTLAYFACAAVAVGSVIGTLLLTVWKDPSKISEPEFFAAIALIIVVMMGLAMPLSIRFGGWAAGLWWRSTAPAEPMDRPLYEKVTRQFRRMGVILAALVVIVALGWGLFLGHR